MANLEQLDQQIAAEVTAWEVALREGYNVRQMFEKTVAVGIEPLAGEVQTLLAEAQTGTAFPEALKHWAQRTQSRNVYLLVNTLLVQREVGGNLADLLQVMGQTMQRTA